MSGAWSAERLARLDALMARHVAQGGVPGLVGLVERRGEVHVITAGRATLDADVPVRRDTIFRIASMTKPITAVATLLLVEDGVLHLDDPVTRWLPELADRRVLTRIDAELDDTVPAQRDITVRDCLTFRLGIGILAAKPDSLPILRAMYGLTLGFGPPKPAGVPAPDEWLRRFATLPLMAQPGERWLYHVGSDLLGVLIARAAGMPFERFLQERIFAPLGMRDTAFFVPAEKSDRFVSAYWVERRTQRAMLYDPAHDGQWNAPPAFPSGGAGLVSTVDDLLAFGRMLLRGGVHEGTHLLSRAAVAAMTSDQLTPSQKAFGGLADGWFDDHGWGFGVSVTTRRTGLAHAPGAYGWDGGLGSTWANDPAEDLVGILLTQRVWDAPVPPPVCQDFWTGVYAAFGD